MRCTGTFISLISGIVLVGCQSAHNADKCDRDCCGVARASITAPASNADSLPAMFAAADARAATLDRVLSGIDEAIKLAANNIASADTIAYRAVRATVAADGSRRCTFDKEQGNLNDTKRDLDVGIQGSGFFKVKILDSAAGGFAYTRNGNLFANHKGELVVGVGDGYLLDPPIMLPTNATDISIGQSGVVEYKQSGGSQSKQAGQLKLCQFINEEQLARLGGALFTGTEASGEPIESYPGEDGAGVVLQGYLEAGNVNIFAERARIRFLQQWRDTMMAALESGPRH